MTEIIIGIIIGVFAILVLPFVISVHFAYVYTFGVTKSQRFPDPYRVVREGDPNAGFRKQLVDGILKEEFEEVKIRSRDGFMLCGKIKVISKDAPFAIMCHGYRSSPFIDFSGGAPMAMRLGYNVLLIHQRAHAESEGKCLTFGVKESLDVADWAKYINDTYGSDVILFGISMGAATVLMCAGLPDLPECVKGAFADCPYSSAKEIIKLEMKARKMPCPPILYFFARLGARIFGGFDPNDSVPKESAMRAKIPLALVHGESDKLVPYSMSYEMHKAANIPLHSFKDATHGTAYIFEPERYEEIVADFCRRCLSKNNTKEV